MYTCKKSCIFSVGYSHEQFYDYRESKFCFLCFVKNSLLCQMYYFIHLFTLSSNFERLLLTMIIVWKTQSLGSSVVSFTKIIRFFEIKICAKF